MNWWAFCVLAWIALGLELGLKGALELGDTGIAPSFVFCLMVFYAMSAPAMTALWTALVLGLLVDLTATLDYNSGVAATVLGPHAAGYVLAAQLVLTLRGLIMRRNPLSMAILCIGGFLVAHVVVVALYTVRASYGEGLTWSPSRQLFIRLGSSLYTGGIGLLMAVALLPLSSVIGVGGGAKRFTPRRGA